MIELLVVSGCVKKTIKTCCEEVGRVCRFMLKQDLITCPIEERRRETIFIRMTDKEERRSINTWIEDIPLPGEIRVVGGLKIPSSWAEK